MLKIVAALAVGALAVIGFWFFAISDREYGSYEGAEIGQPIKSAVSNLKQTGHSVIDEPIGDVCEVGGSYTLTKLDDPSYSISLVIGEECEVSEITRNIRSLEL
ncbi:hypothetical protein [Altererythrobacter sp. ZODW24]|uniref:hypothetical protein n=1 Tax=Altererythrobacter sp. ZODW24 TaxID=2185142 RepID=UPI000DF85F8A|nr:hypothetical protein [Altererythrobacter sp. ZODW24]